MASPSSANARSGGGATRRRVKSARQVAEGVGLGVTEQAAAAENESCTACSSAAAEADAAGLPGAAGLEDGASVSDAAGRGEAGAMASTTTASTGASATAATGASTGTSGMGAAGGGGGAGAVRIPSCLRLWLARARALGLTPPELVFELHVRQGLPLLDVARVLGLGLETVRELWRQSRAARAALAPQSELDFTSMREHIGAALWQTVEATFPDVMAMADAEDDGEPPGAPSPPMLSVRLKALDQIAKLYDITLEQRPAAFAPLPYATPDDIADDVRLRVLEMHGRG